MGEKKNLEGTITAFNTYHTDAYAIAVKNGFEGTEAEWLASLKGHDGEDGYTPVKGVDYWTEAEKNAIVQEVKDETGVAVLYTEQTLTGDRKAQARDNIGAASALMLSNIPNSTQAVTFNADGTIQKVQHKGVDGTVLRTDSYVYSGDTITETRTLANGETMTFTLDTTTLAMEVR